MRPLARPLAQRAAAVVLAAALVCGSAPAAYAATPSGAFNDDTLTGSTVAAIDPTPIGSDEELEARTPTRLLPTDEAASVAEDGAAAAELADGAAASPVCAAPYLQTPSKGHALASNSAGSRTLAASEPQVGDTRAFYSDYRAGKADFAIECVAVGENYTFWMDTEHPDAVLPQDLDLLAENLHEFIDREVKLFGDWRDEGGADVDGDGRAAFVFYPFLEGYENVMGFFQGGDLFEAGADDYATGNVMDALHVNAASLYEGSPASDAFDADLALSTLVHELQHLINYARTGGYSDSWLNEAFSQAAIGLMGIETDDPTALAMVTGNQGYLPPFVYEEDYVPGVDRPESASSYGAWFLFGLYLASQTEGLASTDGTMRGGEGIYRAVMEAQSATDDEGTYETCTRDALTAALEKIGYLGDGQDCVVRTFDELVENFGMAVLLREETGPRSLSNDPTARSTVFGSDVPLLYIAEPAAAIPGGGSLTAVDVEGGSFAVDAQADPRIAYASGDAPLPVAVRVQADPDGGELSEGDPIVLSFAHDVPGGQLFCFEATDDSYVDPLRFVPYEGPLSAKTDLHEVVGAYRCTAGSTLSFASRTFTVTARDQGEDTPGEPTAPPPSEGAPTEPAALPAPGKLAPTGDAATSAVADTAALACFAAAAFAVASRRRIARAGKPAER